MTFPTVLNPLRRTSLSWLFPFTWLIVKSVAPAVPLTVEVFLHQRFGTRSGKNLLIGFFLLIVVSVAVLDGAAPAVVPLFPVFVAAYTVAAVAQWCSSRFAPLPQQTYSYWSGVPWPFWRRLPLATTTVQRYIEPVLCLVFAGTLSSLDIALAQWITIAAVALFIKGQVLRIWLRTQQLDALDNRMLTEQIAPRVRAEIEPFVEARTGTPRFRQHLATRPAAASRVTARNLRRRRRP